MVVGTLIFVAFLRTRSELIAVLGLFVVVFGLIAFVAGTAALAMYLWAELRHPDVSKRAAILRGSLIGSLLLANFPAALVYVRVGSSLLWIYLVVVENRSATPIERLTMSGPSVMVDFGTIQPGVAVSREIQFEGKGQLTYRMRHGGNDSFGVVEEYATNDITGNARLTVGDSGVRVTH